MSFDLKIENGDLSIGADGDLQKVEDSDKLIQDILKMATFPLGGNKYHPWYGSPISNTLVGNVLDFEFTSTVASGQLRNALEKLQQLQKIQATYQKVTPAEQLAALKQVNIQRNQIDPRYFRVFIDVLTGAFTSRHTEFGMSPGL